MVQLGHWYRHFYDFTVAIGVPNPDAARRQARIKLLETYGVPVDADIAGLPMICDNQKPEDYGYDHAY